MAERLTARTSAGAVYLVNVKQDEQAVDCQSRNTAQCIMDSWNRLAAYEDLGTVEELAELVKAKQDNRLISLPCIMPFCNGDGGIIFECLRWDIDYGFSTVSYKTFEAAEAALKDSPNGTP